MDFAELARSRYSLRKFRDEPVSREILTRVLEAGRLAPTGANLQPQRILVLEGPDEMGRLGLCTPYTYGAPMALVVCFDPEVSWESTEGHDVGEIDATFVACHMVLAAQEAGLGSLVVCGYDERALREEFRIPETLRVVMVVCLGYPHPDAHPTWRLHASRLPLSDTVFRGTFPMGPEAGDGGDVEPSGRAMDLSGRLC